MPRLAKTLADRKTAMTVAEVAEMLQVSERQIYQMVKDGEIPSFKVGGAVRFDPHVFGGWLARMVDEPQQKFTPMKVDRAYRSLMDRMSPPSRGKHE